jgi:hypothetical protein
MTVTLLTLFPEPIELLAVEPEDLAGVLLEIIPSVSQSAGFTIEALLAQVYRPDGRGYPPAGVSQEIAEALAEALAWLQNQVIVIRLGVERERGFSPHNLHSLKRGRNVDPGAGASKTTKTPEKEAGIGVGTL